MTWYCIIIRQGNLFLFFIKKKGQTVKYIIKKTNLIILLSKKSMIIKIGGVYTWKILFLLYLWLVTGDEQLLCTNTKKIATGKLFVWLRIIIIIIIFTSTFSLYDICTNDNTFVMQFHFHLVFPFLDKSITSKNYLFVDCTETQINGTCHSLSTVLVDIQRRSSVLTNTHEKIK